MWWFWAIFLIAGIIGALIYCKLDDNSPPSKNNSSTKKEESIDSMIAKIKQNSHTTNPSDASNKSIEKIASIDPVIIENAIAFISLCEKIERMGSKGYGLMITKKESTFYIKYTFHDVIELEVAHDSIKKCENRLLPYHYDSILKKVQPTPKEQGFFLQDLSDFTDFLRGGITGWNKFIREGSSSYYTIEQNIGSCALSEVETTYLELKHFVETHRNTLR